MSSLGCQIGQTLFLLTSSWETLPLVFSNTIALTQWILIDRFNYYCRHMSATATRPDAPSGDQKSTVSKILVGIDGSDASIDAMDCAISLSVKYSAELYALHVIHSDVDLFGRHETSEFMAKMRNEGEAYLNRAKLKVNEKNVQIKTEITSSSSIAGGVLDYADKKNIDLIVIGTRGRSGFKRLLLGSVASHVITYAHCPIFVAK